MEYRIFICSLIINMIINIKLTVITFKWLLWPRGPRKINNTCQ